MNASLGRPPATPFLTRWTARMAKGTLGEKADAFRTWVYDDLWRAACWERAALGEWAAGNRSAALADLARAREAFPAHAK